MINPQFEIIDSGICVCKSHSNSEFLAEDIYQKRILTKSIFTSTLCKSCVHYHKNECFFTKREINKTIRWCNPFIGIFSKYKCEICGSPIRNTFVILRKLFIKRKNKQESPLICTECQDEIQKNTIKKRVNFFLKFDIFLLIILFSTVIPIIVIMSLISTNLHQIIFLSFFSIIMILLLQVPIRRIWKLIHYKKVLKKMSLE